MNFKIQVTSESWKCTGRFKYREQFTSYRYYLVWNSNWLFKLLLKRCEGRRNFYIFYSQLTKSITSLTYRGEFRSSLRFEIENSNSSHRTAKYSRYSIRPFSLIRYPLSTVTLTSFGTSCRSQFHDATGPLKYFPGTLGPRQTGNQLR